LPCVFNAAACDFSRIGIVRMIPGQAAWYFTHFRRPQVAKTVGAPADRRSRARLAAAGGVLAAGRSEHRQKLSLLEALQIDVGELLRGGLGAVPAGLAPEPGVGHVDAFQIGMAVVS